MGREGGLLHAHPSSPTLRAVVFTQGRLDVPGLGFDRLNALYDAKVIGDYTGLTDPFGLAF